MARQAKVDPVDAVENAVAEEKEFETLDVSKIKVEVLPEAAARAVHPFDGYPVKKFKMPALKYNEAGRQVRDAKGKPVMESQEFNLTEWVLHNHHANPVHQDRSNRRNKTYHSRSVKDLVLGINSPNVVIQFSTLIKTENGDFYGALVPDPYIRCQLIFKREQKTGAVQVDKNYMLLDPEQSGRLKRCFMALIKPQLDNERAADAITAGEEPAAIREVEYGATEI